jgi:glycosyltransferase involved in cell wall biosynthesis
MSNIFISSIWFWQRIVSPHMAGLAVALAHRGCKVTYVAEQAMSFDRAEQGWAVPELPGVELFYVGSSAASHLLATKAPVDSVHICQGIRANGIVATAQNVFAARGLRQWVVMETVNDTGLRGLLKRAEYSRIFRLRRKSLQGVLAIGHRTADWVVARGIPADRVYPIAYFLPDYQGSVIENSVKTRPFRFVFAGRLISLKRVDWLIDALARLKDPAFEFWVVGTGSEESVLQALATSTLGNRVRWLGQLSLPDVPSVMAQGDCLVLPSVHDGWGAVASEALMVGTPVICSDACGVAGVVRASGLGGVFPVNDRAALFQLLTDQLAHGAVSDVDRRHLASWATCLGATAGALYLQEILEFKDSNAGVRPSAPWLAIEHHGAGQTHKANLFAEPDLEER